MYELHIIPSTGAHTLWTAGIPLYIHDDEIEFRQWFVRCLRTGEGCFMHFTSHTAINACNLLRFRSPYMSFFKSYYIK